jgi:hypothetical protein
VLPHDAHAAAEASSGHGSHEDHSHDALHEASCEAVPSPTTAALAAPVSSVSIVAPTIVAARGLTHAARTPAITTSPPLFLLHAALRI